MISKHVNEILEVCRENYRTIKCVEALHDSYKKFEIESSNLYPDLESKDVFILNNNKVFTTDDLEFAEIMNLNGNQVVFLGNYRFFFEDSVFNI
ncbi:MAG: hypothetical protein RL736_302 [Pseudomonadota bacterium]|jgi:hypothetical protein